MKLLAKLRERLHRRKHNREVHRRKHQPRRTHREMRAIQKLRKAIRRQLRILAAPRTMYDAVVVDHIPKDAKAVAGYVNGNYQTFPSLKAGWPKARKVSIAVTSSVDAHCLDVEPGDATNGDAPGWFFRHDRKKYGKAIFYTSASNVAPLMAVLEQAGIKRADFKVWAAHFTNHRHVCSPDVCGYPSADGTQFTTHQESLDESALRPSFWE